MLKAVTSKNKMSLGGQSVTVLKHLLCISVLRKLVVELKFNVNLKLRSEPNRE